MTSEPKKFVKVTRKRRMKGVLVPLDQETWGTALKHSNIPLDTPLDQLRVTRYCTKSRNIILRVKHIDKIKPEELEMRR